MTTPKPPLVWLLLHLLALALSLFPHASMARGTDNHCVSTLCGNLSISYPFRLKTQPQNCGVKSCELVCENNRAIFPAEHGNFYVQRISYANQTFQLVDLNLENDNCSLPLGSLPFNTTSSGEFSRLPGTSNTYTYSGTGIVFDTHIYQEIYVVKCSTRMNKSWSGVNYIDASRCSSSPPAADYFYYFLDGRTTTSGFHHSCTVEARVPISLRTINGLSSFDIYKTLMKGVQLKWIPGFLNDGRLYWNSVLNGLKSSLWVLVGVFLLYIQSIAAFILQDTSMESVLGSPPSKGIQSFFVAITGIILIRTCLGICCLITLVIRKIKARHLAMDEGIENFLRSHNNFMPIRYSYAEIKRITQGFKNKLGQGGFGTLFKGKLRSGKPVAIKLLNESKGNGQDFINEVATVGRIHHVNVVQLIGFCVEGKKQALVYDFMMNGSLDKLIFSTESSSLSWEKMFEVAVGIGRGIEYLHNGCEMQILHFDIKPHNILLDDNFTPKVSDFGLAKSYSVDDSIVSLTAARGTIGYMAPELFYKSIGGISYKADVYSFGMMLIEIVGRRKNLNAYADHRSQIYFPSWIYDRLDLGENIELGDMTENENRIARKMIIVAIWCIQTRPIHRPSMSRVLKMLESEVEVLEIPPKSFVFSTDMSDNDSD
ncbi:putative receptor-like protein kinase [Hibiscus syriacus]|uniref:Receptor-like protein kinase n=1 Tax=Hibiscus syriacus TaxID=106335 RepID=A0A6A3AK82_HIBSY|nr:rust resistance kinase Lr10-like [Hibiscus syriacus]KAE8703329.1 putative receptor-like protein kinase [Hibiscus syriacus]